MRMFVLFIFLMSMQHLSSTPKKKNAGSEKRLKFKKRNSTRSGYDWFAHRMSSIDRDRLTRYSTILYEAARLFHDTHIKRDHGGEKGVCEQHLNSTIPVDPNRFLRAGFVYAVSEHGGISLLMPHAERIITRGCCQNLKTGSRLEPVAGSEANTRQRSSSRSSLSKKKTKGNGLPSPTEERVRLSAEIEFESFFQNAMFRATGFSNSSSSGYDDEQIEIVLTRLDRLMGSGAAFVPEDHTTFFGVCSIGAETVMPEQGNDMDKIWQLVPQFPGEAGNCNEVDHYEPSVVKKILQWSSAGSEEFTGKLALADPNYMQYFWDPNKPMNDETVVSGPRDLDGVEERFTAEKFMPVEVESKDFFGEEESERDLSPLTPLEFVVPRETEPSCPRGAWE